MYRCAVLFLIVVAGGTPAVSSWQWQQALPGTPMPEAIADLVRKGSDDAPRVEHYSAFPSISVCGAWRTGMCTASLAAPTGIFFHDAQLRPGSTMAISFPAEAEPPILPHDLAEKVPFTNLSAVLTTFNIPKGSAEASHVATTLSLCQSAPHPGELRACTTSLETTVWSSMNMLIRRSAGDHHGMWVATSVLPAGGLPRQVYEVLAVTKLDGDYYVGCHKVPFPYRVYQCHMTDGLTDKAYVVSLRGLVGGGPTAKMLAFCHFDTAKWNPGHPAFEVLGTHPGTPVCHFMPYANPVFGNKATKP